MKVLITGAKGQLGSALQATAPSRFQIDAVDRAALDLSVEGAAARFVRDGQYALVVNAAAYTAVDKAESEEALAFAVNDRAVGEMAAALAETGGRLVHISTDFVFDGQSSAPYPPDAPRAPLSTYGRSKAAGEDHLRAEDLLIRTSWVHAAGGANFVRTMLRLMREKDEVRVVSDQIGAPTWARGLAQVIWRLIGEDARGTFHHSDAGTASWYDLAIAIQEEARAMGLLDRGVPIIPIRTSDYPTPAPRPAFSLLDCSATRALLGDGHTHWRVNLWNMLREEKTRG